MELNGRCRQIHIIGDNQLDYLGGKSNKSPRREFIHLGDAADIANLLQSVL